MQIGSVVNTALSTKGGWLDRAVQKAMEESYGKDWKNRKYVSDGKEISSSEIYAKAKQGIYDNINGVWVTSESHCYSLRMSSGGGLLTSYIKKVISKKIFCPRPMPCTI